jgi:hypothetical protein
LKAERVKVNLGGAVAADVDLKSRLVARLQP